MPIYEFHCGTCNTTEDRIVRLNYAPQQCSCGATMGRVSRFEAKAIYCWSDGQDFGIQGGEKFYSKRQRDAYEAQYSYVNIVGQNDPSYKIKREESRHLADVAAQNAGYKDHATFRVERKREKALKKGVATPDQKKLISCAA